MLFKDGLLPADLEKLLCHAQLPPSDGDVVRNLELLGARVAKPLKDQRPPTQRLFPPKQQVVGSQEDYTLSRFDTAVKLMLEDHVRGTLDPTLFPYIKPDPSQGDPSALAPSESLRTAKPTWADSRSRASKPRQRIIVFMAGGATYSEVRTCYEISQQRNRDVILATSHMLTPGLWMRQLGDLSVDRRRLGLPADQPPKRAPAHLFEREPAPKPPPQAQAAPPAPPAKQMASMNLNGNAGSRPHAAQPGPLPPKAGGPPYYGNTADAGRDAHKLTKDKDKDKKKHHFFGSKK